ncbi:biopolymer transporter ExbD [Chitinophaga parva]|uniref:Biopolymer transporter ExbD n=1 Tax=Chitinophaga parva TaxID=2169414 RepID=A0A2T7BKJ8_9BACT|nr:biopolymer transporter ExbD [Chitinophaga parva]PUZ28198.1 biopolymer transporter ExbD [Chitinophaga parva]
MAGMNTNTQTRSRGGVRRSKKLSTRVDMTPMVDLGFLLITFFMLTTTMAKPRVTNLLMPASDGKQMPLSASKALTVLLGPDNRIAFYESNGEETAPHPQDIHNTTYAEATGIGDIIRRKQKLLAAAGHPGDLMLLIKPASSSTYKNAVDLLDEVSINRVHRYAFMDIAPWEAQYFQ